MIASLTLEFHGNSPELTATNVSTLIGSQHECVRGKTGGYSATAGTFQWTYAVQALCLLFSNSVIAHRYPEKGITGRIMGMRGSLASSLDYALTKQPVWLRDMFGCDASGNTLARRVICCTNPNRKRPGPVILGVNGRVMNNVNIDIFWDGDRIKCFEQIQGLAISLAQLDDKSESISQLPTPLFQVAI